MRLLSVAVVLGVFSVSLSAPLHPSCETQIAPMERVNTDAIIGKWFKIGESSGIPLAMELLKTVMENSWLEISVGQNTTINVYEVNKIAGRCIGFSYSGTFENGSVRIEFPITTSSEMLNMDSTDCLLWQSKTLLGRMFITSLMLYCKKNNAPLEELETFKKHAECLKLPPPMIFNKDTEHCPDPKASQQRHGVTDLNSYLTGERLEELKRLVDSGGMADFLEKNTNSSAILQQFKESISLIGA